MFFAASHLKWAALSERNEEPIYEVCFLEQGCLKLHSFWWLPVLRLFLASWWKSPPTCNTYKVCMIGRYIQKVSIEISGGEEVPNMRQVVWWISKEQFFINARISDDFLFQILAHHPSKKDACQGKYLGWCLVTGVPELMSQVQRKFAKLGLPCFTIAPSSVV